MKEEIIIARNKLGVAVNEPLKYISVETDNASPQENKIIEQLVEELNTKREFSYYLPIYKAAKNFVETFAKSYELDKDL